MPPTPDQVRAELIRRAIISRQADKAWVEQQLARLEKLRALDREREEWWEQVLKDQEGAGDTEPEPASD